MGLHDEKYITGKPLPCGDAEIGVAVSYLTDHETARYRTAMMLYRKVALKHKGRGKGSEPVIIPEENLWKFNEKEENLLTLITATAVLYPELENGNPRRVQAATHRILTVIQDHIEDVLYAPPKVGYLRVEREQMLNTPGLHMELFGETLVDNR